MTRTRFVCAWAACRHPVRRGAWYTPSAPTSTPIATAATHTCSLHPQTPEYPHGDGSCPGPCDCGTVPCGEYLWDHRNDTLTAWMVNDFVLGPTGLGNANVSGLYFDDA